MEKKKDKIRELKLTLRDSQDELDNLEQKCSKCGNELTLKQYKAERVRLKDLVSDISDGIENLYNKKEELKEELSEINESIDEIEDLEEEKDNYQSVLSMYSEVWSKLEQAKINAKDVKTKNDEKVNGLKTKIVKDEGEDDYDELKDEYDEASKSVTLAEDRIVKQKEINNEKVIELKKFRRFIKTRNSLKKKLRILALVKSMFSSTGIQSDIINEAIPELEEYSNDILSKFENSDLQLKIFTEDLKGNDTFDWEVTNKGQRLSYRAISSGEKMRVSFAFRIGNGLRCSHVKGCKFNFLIIDEIHALDHEGLEEFVDIIKALSSMFKHILVISHLEEIKQYFSTQILVTQKGTDSKVKIIKNNAVL